TTLANEPNSSPTTKAAATVTICTRFLPSFIPGRVLSRAELHPGPTSSRAVPSPGREPVSGAAGVAGRPAGPSHLSVGVPLPCAAVPVRCGVRVSRVVDRAQQIGGLEHRERRFPALVAELAAGPVHRLLERLGRED